MEHYKFFQNKVCEYFPCHKLEDITQFNCLFCYCPLYALKNQCGGNFTYTDKGVKSCIHCTKPHTMNGYAHIESKIHKIINLGKLDPKKEETNE